MGSNIERKLSDPEFHSLVSKGSGKWSKIIKPVLPKAGDVLAELSAAEKVTSVALSNRDVLSISDGGDISFDLSIKVLEALVTWAKLEGVDTKKMADALGEVKFQMALAEGIVRLAMCVRGGNTVDATRYVVAKCIVESLRYLVTEFFTGISVPMYHGAESVAISQEFEKISKYNPKFGAIYSAVFSVFSKIKFGKKSISEVFRSHFDSFVYRMMGFHSRFHPPVEPAPIDDTAAEPVTFADEVQLTEQELLETPEQVEEDDEQPTTEQDQREESGLEFDLVPKEVLERDLFGNRCIKGAITVLDIVSSVSFFLLVRGIYSRFTGN